MASHTFRPVSVDRSVSPLGASRFEQDWVPPRVVEEPSLSDISTDTSATSVDERSPATTASSTDAYRSHTTKPSIASTVPTSILHSPADASRPGSSNTSVPTELIDADEWFGRFHSATDASADETDPCPDRAQLAAVYNIPIYDAGGHPRPFGSLFDPAHAQHTRQLIIFVRHFFCGACQAYLQALTDGITMHEYFTMPTPTSIIVVGCGQPELIKHYKTFTNHCPFPIFADPSRELFKKLGMRLSLNIGSARPEYMREISPWAWAKGQGDTIRKSLRDPEGIKTRDVLRGGNPMQIGGEFLFDDGQVVWCHRMKHYRNHAEIAVLRRLLQIDE